MSGIKITQKDGNLKSLDPKMDDGIFGFLAKGDNSKGDFNKAYLIAKESDAIYWFGKNTPMHEAAKLHFRLGGKSFYGVMPENDVPGSVSSITEENKTGNATVTIDASSVPTVSNSYEVVIVDPGEIGVATLRYKINNEPFGASVTINSALFALEGGVVLNFVEGVPSTDSFKTGDTFKFTSTAPSFTLLTAYPLALEAFKEAEIEGLALFCNVDDVAIADALNLQKEENSNNKPLRVYVQVLARQGGETDADYLTRLENTILDLENTGQLSVHCQSVYSQVLKKEIPSIHEQIATLSRAKVQHSEGWRKAYKQTDVKYIVDKEFFSVNHDSLEAIGYSLLAYDPGPKSVVGTNPYWNSRTKAEQSSDYTETPTQRVSNKLKKLTFKVIHPYLHGNEKESTVDETSAKGGLVSLANKLVSVYNGAKGRAEITGHNLKIPALIEGSLTATELAQKIASGQIKIEVDLYKNTIMMDFDVDMAWALPVLEPANTEETAPEE